MTSACYHLFKMSMLLQLERLMKQLTIKRSEAQKELEDANDKMKKLEANVRTADANLKKACRKHKTRDIDYVYDETDYAYDDTYDELAKRVYCKKEYTVKPKSSKAHRKHVKRDDDINEGDMVYHDAYGVFRKRVHSKNKEKSKRVIVDDRDGIWTRAKGRNKTKTTLFKAFKTHMACQDEADEDYINRVEALSEVEYRVHNYLRAWLRIHEAEDEVMGFDEHIKMIQYQYRLAKERMNAVAMMLHPRLSEESPCSVLKPEILRCIMQHL